MLWRTAMLVAVATLVALSGVPGSAIANGIDSGVESARPLEAQSSLSSFNHTPDDPESDVLGWEAGYWHNESIKVNQTDGLNRSELNATISRTMARIEHIRQLEFTRPVPVEITSRDSYQQRQSNDTISPTLRLFDNAKFETLFLIGENQDSIDIQKENAGASVLGHYNSRRDVIVLISENTSVLEVEEVTLGHELVHALQDQHFNLSRYNAKTRDQANAENGLIEGDASLVEFRYKQRCRPGGSWNGTCLSQSGDGSSGKLANIGVYFVNIQPYSDGPTFITSLYREGGWSAVNAAYENPPRSSEQVIHPEKYNKDEPTNVTIRDRDGDNWDRVRPPNRPDHGVLGEAAITSMLIFPLYDSDGQTQIISLNDWLNTTQDGDISEFDPLNYQNQYASGWDGDRFHVYVNEANETATVWRLVWDTPADAIEFIDGYTQVMEYWGAESTNDTDIWIIDSGAFPGAYHIERANDTVTLVNAPSVEQLQELRSGTLGTPTPSPSPDPSPTPSPSPLPTPTPTQSSTTVPTASPSSTQKTASTASATPTLTSTPGQVGFGWGVALLALLCVLGLRRWDLNS